MVIVLIHWRIKPTDEAQADFFKFWIETATIPDKSALVGEFLSAPVPASAFPYTVDDLGTGHSRGRCLHFVNVGVWHDRETFHAQIGRLMNDDKPLLAFESERRTRTVLDPLHFRIGDATLPAHGSCD